MTKGEKEYEKKCFIVTPIGNDESNIRRHIDGIIDQAIIPAIGDKYYIEVAHREYKIGSINDRVISSLYEADLVIANLTTLNPNVMFELAVRYSFGKPAIVIAEKETKLPFDIIDENTIFYINDPAGAYDLKKKLEEFEKRIDCNKENYGPVYRAISKIPLYKAVEMGENVSNNEMLSYVVERLNSLEKSVNSFYINRQGKRYIGIIEVLFDTVAVEGLPVLREQIESVLSVYEDAIRRINYITSGIRIFLNTPLNEEIIEDIISDIKILMERNNIDDYRIRKRTVG